VTKWWRFARLSPVADLFQTGPRIERRPVGGQAIAQDSVDTGEPARMETS
jgi:hypothetical protein